MLEELQKRQERLKALREGKSLAQVETNKTIINDKKSLKDDINKDSFALPLNLNREKEYNINDTIPDSSLQLEENDFHEMDAFASEAEEKEEIIYSKIKKENETRANKKENENEINGSSTLQSLVRGIQDEIVIDDFESREISLENLSSKNITRDLKKELEEMTIELRKKENKVINDYLKEKYEAQLKSDQQRFQNEKEEEEEEEEIYPLSISEQPIMPSVDSDSDNDNNSDNRND